jgi:hypothetical protein
MFGYNITIFKKSKGVEVAAVAPKESISKSDKKAFEKFKREAKWAKEQEVLKRNQVFLDEWYTEFMVAEVLSFKLKTEAPFNIGDMVTPIYFGGNWNKLGYHGGGADISVQFKERIPALSYFTAPIHKIWIDQSWVSDRIDTFRAGDVNVWDGTRDHNGNRNYVNTWDLMRLDNATAKHKIRYWLEEYTKKLREEAVKRTNMNFLVEWCCDFDWPTLAYPDPTEDDPNKTFNLRWGGFVMTSFHAVDSKFAKAQRKYIKKEEEFQKAKKKMNDIEEEMKLDLAKLRNKCS